MIDDIHWDNRGNRDAITFMHLACQAVVSGGETTVDTVQATRGWNVLAHVLMADEKQYLPVIQTFIPDAVQLLNAWPIQPFDQELFENKRELYDRLTRSGVEPIVADVIMLDERREVLSSTTVFLFAKMTGEEDGGRITPDIVMLTLGDIV